MRSRGFLDLEIEEPGKLTIRHHEGAIIAALEQPVSGSGDSLKNLVHDTISRLSRWVTEQGGLVGHIKASLQTPTGTFFYSCAGDAVHVRECPDPGETLEFTAIVFFVNEAQLEKQLDTFLERLS